MFLDNKYTKWYHNIINKRKTTIVIGYCEKHHILPKCMGGTDHDSNLVKLTAKEHFMCHLLLTKMVIGHHAYKLSYAFSCMVHNIHTPDRHVTHNSRTYSYVKTLCSEAMRARWQDPEYREKMKKHMHERWQDPEYREKMIQQSINQWTADKRIQRSKKSIEYWKQPMNRMNASERMKERCTDPEFQKLKTFHGEDNGMWGKTHTDEVKQHIGQLAKERYTGKSYEERHGCDKAAELRKKRSTDMKRIRKDRPGNGASNPNHNPDILTFIHTSGDQFVGTRQEFHETHNIRRGDISLLISGKQKTAKGWSINPSF